MKFIFNFSIILFFLFENILGANIPIDIKNFFKSNEYFEEDYTFYCGEEYFNFRLKNNKDVDFDRIVPLEYFFKKASFFDLKFRNSCEKEFNNKDYFNCARKYIPLFVSFENDIYNIFIVSGEKFKIRNNSDFSKLPDWEKSCVVSNQGKFLVRGDILGDIARVIMYVNDKYDLEYMSKYPLQEWANNDPISKYECFRYYRFKQFYSDFEDNFLYSNICQKFKKDLFK